MTELNVFSTCSSDPQAQVLHYDSIAMNAMNALHTSGCSISNSHCQNQHHDTQTMHSDAGEETLVAAGQHISSILSQFNQQNLALALWAFAKLGWRPPTSLLADACHHALLTVETINPQNLSNILWALATMDFMPPTVLLEVLLLASALRRLNNICHHHHRT